MTVTLTSAGGSGAPAPAQSIFLNATQTSASATVTVAIPANTYSVVADYPMLITINSVSYLIPGNSNPTVITVAASATSMTIKNMSLGCTWANGTIPQAAAAIAWNGTVFCAVVSGTLIAYTSPDGLTWTQRALPSSASWGAIVWNGTVFLAIQTGISGTVAATSPDGITWTARTLPTSQVWNAIAWNGTVFAAVGGASSTVSATSPDGATWTNRTITSGTWAYIVWNGTAFLATPASGTAAATSPDGITWTARTLAYSLTGAPTLAASSSLFVVMSNATSTYQTSPDGITWTQRSLGTSNGAPGGITAIQLVYYNATLGIFFAVGTAQPITNLNQNFLIFSTDGINWKIGAIWNNYYTYPQVITPNNSVAFNGSNLMVDTYGHTSTLLSNPFGIYSQPTTTY